MRTGSSAAQGIKLIVKQSSFIVPDHKPTHTFFALNLALESLRFDPHVRRSLYPVYIGSAHTSAPTAAQQQQFDTSLNGYLETSLPEVHLVETQDCVCTCQPQMGEKVVIRLDRWLAVALEEAGKTFSNNYPLIQMFMIVAFLHETAHAYGLYLRQDEHSPLDFTRAGREVVVPQRDENGQLVMVPDGDALEGEIGEAGYMLEVQLFGGGMKLGVVAVVKREQSPFRTIQALELKDVHGTHYGLSTTQVIDWMVRLQNFDSTPIALSLEASVPLHRTLARHGIVDALVSHSPPPSSISTSSTRLAAYDAVNLRPSDWDEQQEAQTDI